MVNKLKKTKTPLVVSLASTGLFRASHPDERASDTEAVCEWNETNERSKTTFLLWRLFLHIFSHWTASFVFYWFFFCSLFSLKEVMGEAGQNRAILKMYLWWDEGVENSKLLLRRSSPPDTNPDRGLFFHVYVRSEDLMCASALFLQALWSQGRSLEKEVERCQRELVSRVWRTWRVARGFVRSWTCCLM